MAEITLTVSQIAEAMNICSHGLEDGHTCERCPMKAFPTNDCDECSHALMHMAALALTKAVEIGDIKDALAAENNELKNELRCVKGSAEDEAAALKDRLNAVVVQNAKLTGANETYEDVCSRMFSMVSTHMHTLLLEVLGNEG